MAERTSPALKAQAGRILAAGFLALVVLGGAAAFAVGYTAAERKALADPGAADALAAAELQQLDDTLGPGDFLEAYRIFLSDGDKDASAALTRFADAATAHLGRLKDLSRSPRERDENEALARLAAPFRRTATFASGGHVEALPPFTEIAHDYTALNSEIAKAARGLSLDRLNIVSDALVWAEAAMVVSLSLLAVALFALAWYLRESVIAPLQALRAAVAAAVSGAKEPLWGTERRDEIGAVARAAENLRGALSARADALAGGQLDDIAARLNKGANTLERDLARITYATAQTRTRIEQASIQAAHASQAAAEAAGLARRGAQRVAEEAEGKFAKAGSQARVVAAALLESITRLTEAAGRLELRARADAPDLVPNIGAADEAHADATAQPVLNGLVADLDALERFARERKSIAGDQAVALTAALIEAIDRLNGVAERISAAADMSAIRAAE